MINRKKIELEKRKKRDQIIKLTDMICDICYSWGNNSVLILKSNRFSKYASKREAKARRVCWSCAKRLFSQKKYNFGSHWRELFFQDSRIQSKNKEKYMVIHA
jgi:hypothetical protein